MATINADLKNLLDLSLDPFHGTINLHHLHGLLNSIIIRFNRSPEPLEIATSYNNENSLAEVETGRSIRSNYMNQQGLQIKLEKLLHHNQVIKPQAQEEIFKDNQERAKGERNQSNNDTPSIENPADSSNPEIPTQNHQSSNRATPSITNEGDKNSFQDEENPTTSPTLDGLTDNKEISQSQLQKLPEITRSRAVSSVSDLWKNNNLSKRIGAAEETLEALSSILDGVVKELDALSTDWANAFSKEIDSKLSLIDKDLDVKIGFIQQSLHTLGEKVQELACSKGSKVDNRINTLDEEVNNVRTIAFNLKQKMNKLPSEATFDSYVTRPVFYDGLKTMKDSILGELEGRLRNLNQLLLNQNQAYQGKNELAITADGRRRSIFDADDDPNRRDSSYGYRARSLTAHQDLKNDRLNHNEFERFRETVNNKLKEIDGILINSDDMLDELRKRVGTYADNVEDAQKDIQLLKERKVDRLELKKLKDTINQSEMSEKLLQQVRQLEDISQEIRDSIKKTNDDIDILQRQSHRLLTEQNKHAVNIRQILDSDDKLKLDIVELFEAADRLSQGKVDKDDLGTEVGKIDEQKADKEEIKDKVNMSDLNTVRLRIEAKITETISKLDKNGLAVKDAVGQLEGLATAVGKKLDKTSISNLRKYLEKYVKKVTQTHTGDKSDKESLNVAELAAGLRKIVPSLPLQQPLPLRSSSRADSPIKVEAVRFHQKHVVGMYDIPSLRSCGGSHTITFPHNRRGIARKEMGNSLEPRLKSVEILTDSYRSSTAEASIASPSPMPKLESSSAHQLHRRSLSSPADSGLFNPLQSNHVLDGPVGTAAKE
ncbi:uncharacterized protein TRIADDRAFT_63613 [Trichoplax adhaerens]|uniref:DUF4795 domain-containing protein n=1 Tax=Trichoplax adhaerens TaxID=10228 RepID=B3RN35_TRIAD|nr:hypothetical protein TRIADDRAFT_63613 [Trichoplax adhaerens]EDV27953.1 hypothetical protein TRIADDRAFT_63613 [Trichoplax adhaerens]|eukprot:XP_002109787.1 hypothetical protein TRIADDRAFT_63613 [Trichoplax adhaerens]